MYIMAYDFGEIICKEHESELAIEILIKSEYQKIKQKFQHSKMIVYMY